MADELGLLRLEGVWHRYASAANEAPLEVLKGISVSFKAGESTAIVGPSGSGKSTLLNIIGTLEKPSSGKVILKEKDLAALDEKTLATVRNREIGFIFQSHFLLPQCSVLENVLTPTLADPQGKVTGEIEERAKSLLARVGLSERLHHRPGQLSGGERQRVAVVRSLINRPFLLLADEPTGALDRQSAERLGDLLLQLNCDEKVALIVVTHSLDLAGQMKRVLELKDGVLKETG